MALKKHLAVYTFLFGAASLAADESLEKLKLMQLYLDKNQLEKVEDVYDENEDILNNKWMAQERLAISFERREKLKEAIDVYRKLIIQFNKPAHDKVISSTSPVEVDTAKLPLYYLLFSILSFLSKAMLIQAMRKGPVTKKMPKDSLDLPAKLKLMKVN